MIGVGWRGSFLVFASLIARVAYSAEDPGWAVKSAPYRAVIRAGEPPHHADAGFSISLPGIGLANPNIEVTDEAAGLFRRLPHGTRIY